MSKSKQTEAFLKELGVKFEYHARFKLSEIDIEASQRNQVRTGQPVNDDQVLVYGMAMEKGDSFPPIVLHRPADGKPAVVDDGNHRVQAHVLTERKTIEAYEVTNASELQILRLQFKANQTNGLALTMKDRVRHALMLHAHGATLKDAADDIGIPYQRVRDAWKRQELQNRLVALGVRNLSRFTDAHLLVLSSIRNDDVLKSLAEPAGRFSISGLELSKLVPKVNKERTIEAQKKLVDEFVKTWSKDEAQRGGKGTPIKRVPAVVGQIRRLHGQIMRITDGEVKALPKEFQDEVLDRSREAATRLTRLNRIRLED